MKRLRILVVGCGRMGAAHARAYQDHEVFEIVGLVSLRPRLATDLRAELRAHATSDAARTRLENLPIYPEYAQALNDLRPDAVSINTYPDTHARFAEMALDAQAHVFVEKPLALTLGEAQNVLDKARNRGLQVVVGYILHHHPAYQAMLKVAKTLGKPLVMRMSLHQAATGAAWERQKHLLGHGSPLIDGGVHYADWMTSAAGAEPVRIQASGCRLSPDLPADACDFATMHITFADGSHGQFEAGWGPHVSRDATSVHECIGPLGRVRLAQASETAPPDPQPGQTGHRHVLHISRKNSQEDGTVGIPLTATPEVREHFDAIDRLALCRREQAFFAQAILEKRDLSEHHHAVMQSLSLVLAAEKARLADGFERNPV